MEAAGSGLSREERKRGTEAQNGEWDEFAGELATRTKRRPGARISTTAAATATASGEETGTEQQKSQAMNFDKLDVNVEEEDPWEEIPGWEFDGICM